ncbi:MAG: hypothetical protein MUC50_00235 [Myxococcota bacterium]|nr:hypothetical protein [Myxococcota bacterium]
MPDTNIHRLSSCGRFFEEWEEGQRFSTSSRRIEVQDVAAFVKLCGDDNPLHADEQPVVPGLLTAAMATGLVADLGLFSGTTVALLRQSCDFLRPLRAPCEVRVELEVLQVRPWRDAAAGVVETRRDIIDDAGIVVARSVHRTLVRSRGVKVEKEPLS